MTKTRIITSLCLLASLLAVPAALAGVKQSQPVYIDVSRAWATGSVGSTRNSSVPDAKIGCIVYASRSGTQAYSYTACGAHDGKNYLSCIYDGPFVTAAAAISEDSHIQFEADRNGFCTSLNVTNDSTHEVKQP